MAFRARKLFRNFEKRAPGVLTRIPKSRNEFSLKIACRKIPIISPCPPPPRPPTPPPQKNSNNNKNKNKINISPLGETEPDNKPFRM